ncbi:chromogranin-A [Hippocampus zosterae]|uniref:chromogranin-A n=1 Tax=Hippocampus zosterae TaxID=109293 RepID=UPI00223CDEF4|nr:chromogranin-A [Hippocampus zosterae]
MIALLTLTILFKSVLLLPLTPSMLEHDDVKVMQCVVEALVDVLSRPHHLPVSQECLHTLRTDDHLLTLLRHSDFLKELQDVATQGGDERAWPPGGGAIAPHHEMPAPRNADGVPDGSMLNALGGSGERAIVSQEPRRSKEEDKGGEDEKKEDEEDNRVWTSEEKRQTVSEEEEEEEEGMKKRSKGFLLGKKSGSAEEEGEEEALHHSKEVSEEEEVKRKRNHSPEEKELQMIARRTPEEEDGSAARKSEDPEVENLAAIEAELENVSQKLHQLRG